MSATYDRAYFIAKFEAIDESRWCTDRFVDDAGRCCAQGHCGNRADILTPPECRALKDLFRAMIPEAYVSMVNDGHDPRHQHPTPKQRVLAALRDGV